MSTDDPQAPNIDTVIGANIRRLRDQRGSTQDDVAREFQAVGLDWSRAIVAAVEDGRRRIGADDLVLAAYALGVSPADLLEGSGPVLAGALAVRLADLREAFSDQPVRQVRAWVPKQSEAEKRAMSRQLQATIRYLESAWPDVTVQELAAAKRDARGEAEQKAARRLGVSAEDVSVAAHARWGRSLTAERDARVEDAEPTADRRVLQARRGHVTRQLLADLGPVKRRRGS